MRDAQPAGPVVSSSREMMLENDPPVLPVAYEKIYDAWHNKVHGQNPAGYFGIYDVVRWDNGWLAS